jgi:hypothetical protein
LTFVYVKRDASYKAGASPQEFEIARKKRCKWFQFGEHMQAGMKSGRAFSAGVFVACDQSWDGVLG